MKWVQSLTRKAPRTRFLTPHLCVRDRLFYEGEQFIGEEGRAGFDESKTLSFIDVCHDLSQRDEAEVKWREFDCATVKGL